MATVNFKFSVINITTHPHSCEKYIELFQDAFSCIPPLQIKYYGNECISIVSSNIKYYNNEKIICGLICKYTQIQDGDWYNSKNGTVLSGDDRPNFDIKSFHPNAQYFEFIFIPNGHRLFITTKHGDLKLSQAFLAKALSKLFNDKSLQEKYGEVNVTVEIDTKGMEAIERMERLERLFIRVHLPNGDDLSKEQEAFIERMKNQKASVVDENIKASKNEHITPDKQTKALMELAKSNGFIIARGIENGEKVTKKSSEYPVEYKSSYEPKEENLLDKLISEAISKISNFIQRKNN